MNHRFYKVLPMRVKLGVDLLVVIVCVAIASAGFYAHEISWLMVGA